MSTKRLSALRRKTSINFNKALSLQTRRPLYPCFRSSISYHLWTLNSWAEVTFWTYSSMHIHRFDLGAYGQVAGTCWWLLIWCLSSKLLIHAKYASVASGLQQPVAISVVSSCTVKHLVCVQDTCRSWIGNKETCTCFFILKKHVDFGRWSYDPYHWLRW